MRRTLVALATAAAVTLAPLPALAADQSSSQVSQSDASSESNLKGSSYIKWLDENVSPTDNEATNRFLQVLVDGAFALLGYVVVGSIVGEIMRQIP